MNCAEGSIGACINTDGVLGEALHEASGTRLASVTLDDVAHPNPITNAAIHMMLCFINALPRVMMSKRHLDLRYLFTLHGTNTHLRGQALCRGHKRFRRRRL